MYNNILTEENNGVALITINRPKQLNALNKETIAELSQHLDKVDQEIHEV